MARTRIWSYSTPDADAYIEVDVVGDEAVSVHWFNSTGVGFLATFQWKNLPTPTERTIDGDTGGEQQIGIPPGQRKWIVVGVDVNGDPVVDNEISVFSVEAIT